mgnify:FL=1
MEMAKTYEPQNFEKDLYHWWEREGFFTPERDPEKEPFTIVIPPPNITGQLHMGHALDESIQDCIIRFKRMQGYSTLWLPGTDHASIATEVKIVEQLAKEGIDKRDLGREKFLERAWAWKNQYGGRIVEQLKCLGSSCDWTREAFTMDERCSRAVRHVFVKLYEEGLIYQGDRIINWCPECKTALSDAEVEYREQASHFWHFRYFTPDGKTEVVFATTRPETMLGDTAIAVNPDDERYKNLVGKTVIVPFVDREIPVIADEYVEKDFGTGVVKITPAHDPNDFEVGLRHNLPVIRVMNDDGTMNSLAGEMFEGLDRYAARDKIVKEMEKLGQLVKIEDYSHNVGECYRCHTTVEPIVSKQWFVKMKPLAEKAIEVVRNGEINFVPKRFEKVYFNWMENIKDWCISRQLWWGHRIPVWYCEDCGEVICREETPTECPKCHGKKLRQDEDVLDTWFSSALWPFSTLGYPEETEDFKYFFPTNVLVTGYDIIFFWVARMIFSSLHHTGKAPFKEVLIHGIVRDAQGRKMSKSLGNGVDPLEFIDKFGADTLRFSLLNGVSSGGDIRFSADKVEGNRNFMNKIWNASRFVLMNTKEKNLKDIFSRELSVADKWILDKLNNVIKDVTANMESYELGVAAGNLYDFVWSEFCDWYIEFSKPVLYGTDEDARDTAISVLNYCLDKILKLLHPFVPFITEAVYQNMYGHEKTIMLTEYPKFDGRLSFPDDADTMDIIKDIVKAVRNARAERNVPPSKRLNIFIRPVRKGSDIKRSALYIEKLAGAENVVFAAEGDNFENAVSLVSSGAEIFIPLGDLVDKEKESARLGKEIKDVRDEIARAEGKLANKGFVEKAPQKLIDAEKAKLEKYRAMLEKLEQRAEELSSL